MNILNLDIKNCYGIGFLQHEIDYSQASVGVIYAPNGTMKTSLTKTFQRLIDGKNPCDEIYTHRESSAKIQLDGNPITHDSVYIFSNEEKDGTTQISTFLVNAKLKLQYDAILSQITQAKRTFIKQLKGLAKSTDCESEIIETFQDTPDDTFFDCLLHIQQLIESNAPYINDKSFRYNDLFDKGHKVEQFVKENIDDILQYFDKYVQLLQGSSLFSVGENSFGTAQVSTLLKSVSDNRFFAASHKFLLHNENTISSKDDMQEVIDNELNKIYSDDTIKKLFEKIDKKLQANADLRNFQDVIQSNQDLIPELIDYDALRKKILLGYIISAEASFSELVGVYSANIDSIKTLIAQANETRSQWEFVIDIFNSRFFVPFKLKLQNKADILLNQVAPELIFVYKDGADGPIPQERKVLLEHLSKGEKHAFFILQNLFELEARKAIGKPTLIVFDDVADSFDYKNKYAIIEYLSDIANESLFTMLILTHNFDFYRSIVSRLNVGGNVFVANKNVSREVALKHGLYRSDLLKCRIIDKLNTKRAFISCIPFARNIIEYTQGDSEDFKLLTSCLHIKDNTDTISINSIKDIFIRTLAIKQQVKEKINYDDDELYLSAVYDEANKIMLDDNEIELTNKLVLSIAIRLKAEQYMKSVLTIEQLNEMKKNSNQTGELVKLFKKHHIQTLENNCHIMNQVLMLTSENIHINNFMFEPLVDISILYLKDLYRKIQGLTE
ncbi:MAG: hypothetical protein IKV22_06735 [Paludibacteraceae bacterium]|nr:hypothetical protein [Paludibacteraceae bacterium]